MLLLSDTDVTYFYFIKKIDPDLHIASLESLQDTRRYKFILN